MSLAWFPPSETEQEFGHRELSAYEQHLENQRQERVLKQQLRKYGDDAMRVDPQMNLTDAASSLPTESFTRAYQMRMPGSARPSIAPGFGQCTVTSRPSSSRTTSARNRL